MAFASSAVISLMNRVKYPYNINVLTQAHVAKALERGVADQVAQIIAERARVIEALEGFATVERVYPTDANFVLIKVADANKMYDELVEAGVIVRNRTKIVGCKNTLRLTIGTAAENDRMLEIIKTK